MFAFIQDHYMHIVLAKSPEPKQKILPIYFYVFLAQIHSK